MMIARQEGRGEIWQQLAEPVPPHTIAWRQDGKPINRDGRYFARFVCYIEANTVRDRLDAVVPGEWDLTLDVMPQLRTVDRDGIESLDADAAVVFKARLQILGVIREDVGTGKDYKQASTDAFKRVAVRFGIGHELYDYEQNWVEVDGEAKYPKPLEDPAVAYARRHGKPAPSAQDRISASAQAEYESDGQAPTNVPMNAPVDIDAVSCPKCGGRMWDNRLTKRNAKAPDYKCRDRSCDGVVWPPRADGADTPADDTPMPKSTRRTVPKSTDDIPF